MLNASIRVIGKDIVDAKVLMAAPNILAHNRVMVTAMLTEIKKVVVAETPTGPGHFGYHLRDSYVIDVKSGDVKTTGVLKAPAQGYWREFGTKGRFKNLKRSPLRSYAAAIGGLGNGGEPALMVAHKALAGVKKFINFYYGGLATWWGKA